MSSLLPEVIRRREVVKEQMPWKCVDCGAKFMGPTDRAPEGGCAICGSRRIFDCNVSFIAWIRIRG